MAGHPLAYIKGRGARTAGMIGIWEGEIRKNERLELENGSLCHWLEGQEDNRGVCADTVVV
jgi:hypothetical protein